MQLLTEAMFNGPAMSFPRQSVSLAPDCWYTGGGAGGGGGLGGDGGGSGGGLGGGGGG
jgi:hypothetical protein